MGKLDGMKHAGKKTTILLQFLHRNKFMLFMLHIVFRMWYGKSFTGTFYGIPIIKTDLLN
jgi:hypothetical protein